MCVRITLEQPNYVVHDVTYENRENIYRVSPLPPPHYSVWVKIVVKFDAEGGEEVITIYLTDRKNQGSNENGHECDAKVWLKQGSGS